MSEARFDITSSAYKRNPYPTLSRLLQAGPVVEVKFPLIGPLSLATTYQAADELLRDRQTFVRDPVTAGLRAGSHLPWWMPATLGSLTRVMINRDEPDHRRLRSLVEQAFQRRSIEQLQPRLTQLADQFLDHLEAQSGRNQPVDLVAGLAQPYPLAVICELLGLPAADRPFFTRQAEYFTSKLKWWTVWRMVPAVKALSRYVREKIAEYRQTPRPGLISELIAAEVAGERFTDEEMISMVIMILTAGHVTTVHLLSGGIFTLLTHPEQLQLLQADWSRNAGCVNEVLRYLSPVQLTKPMLAARELEWQGQHLRRGQKLVAFLASANVDPARFTDPEQFQILRPAVPHLAFGAGIHVCLGLKLAKAEAETVFQRLWTRFPQLQISEPVDQVRWSNAPGTRGLERLLVQLCKG